MTDFAALSRAARELPGPDTHDRLWSAWFALPAWHFLKMGSPMGILPASIVLHGQRCVLAFATGERAFVHARQTQHPDRVAPVLSLVPEVAVQLVPRLQMYGATGLVAEPGPDSFFTPLASLFAMLHRYRPAPVPVGMAPPRVAPPPPAPPQAPGPAPAPRVTIEHVLALPAWHLVTSPQDPNAPGLDDRGGELVARIYSRPSPERTTTAMPPDHVLQLLVDMELVRFVRFDDQLEVELVDLALRRRRAGTS